MILSKLDCHNSSFLLWGEKGRERPRPFARGEKEEERRLDVSHVQEPTAQEEKKKQKGRTALFPHINYFLGKKKRRNGVIITFIVKGSRRKKK